MSHSTYFPDIKKKAYKYVGSNEKLSKIDNDNYITDQSKILKNQENLGIFPNNMTRTSHTNLVGSLKYGISIPEFSSNDETTEYNAYYDFLDKRGLLKENGKPRIVSKTFTINSNVRQTEPTITLTDEINLDTDPISFGSVDVSVGINYTKQSIIIINAPNHNIQENDRITLTGIEPITNSIKTIYYDTNGTKQYAVYFTENSTSVVFFCTFPDDSMSFDPAFKVGDGIDHTELKNYETADMFVSISGFDISENGDPFVGNIPINFLNSTHQVYFTNPNFTVQNGTYVYDSDTLINVPDADGIVKKITGFYINLETPFVGTNPNSPMTLNLTFNYIGGAPINELNAQFPIDENNSTGYHKVYSVTPNTISVMFDKLTYYKNPTKVGGISETQQSFGGSNIYMSKISNLISGYSDPNQYVAPLPFVMHDVVMVKLLSTTFPNTTKVFNNRTGTKNTKLYWQNQDDGDFIYSIELEPGNYSPSQLETLLQSKFYEVERKYSKISGTTTSYTARNFMTVKINKSTNLVTIAGFKEANLIKPIQDISPEIPSVGSGNPPYTLTISQDSHGLLPGDSVTFSGFVSTSGIPADILNSTHIVNSVPTSDTYTIVIDSFNLLAGTRSDTGGGYAAKAHVPSAFKLLFNYPDTMGKELGFRKVGQDLAITNFSKIITNADSYQKELTFVDNDGNNFVYDESGNLIPLRNNSLKLSGYDYAYMVIRNFDNMINISNNNSVVTFFAKINISDAPGEILYNTFSCPPLIFYEPVDVSMLDIAFYASDGTLYDFNGIDHCFDIELTSIEYVPSETGIVTTKSGLAF